MENITRYTRIINALRETDRGDVKLDILHNEAANLIGRLIREREQHFAKMDEQSETIYKLMDELKRVKAFVRIKVRKREL